MGESAPDHDAHDGDSASTRDAQGGAAPRPGAPHARAAGAEPTPVSLTPPPTPSEGALPVDDDPFVGTVLLERVRIDRPLARGGMGKVYFGELVRMKRACAVKVLSPRLAAGADVEEFARRFLLEASTAAKLTHPNVVTIFDYGETPDGSCFIAMELLSGRSLSDELKAQGRMAPERAIHVARQVARALREAHALGVVHRDIKPGNVLLVKHDDDDDFVKVLDFGLVKATKAADSQDPHTQIGQILGSPRYMSPEQVQSKPVDARTDVYSLGAMMYAMLSGRPPFDKPNDIATLMAHVAERPKPIASVAPDAVLPPGLEAVVMRCLAKRPEDRFASMEELIAALKLQPGESAPLLPGDSGEVPAAAPSPLLSPAAAAAPAPRRSAMPLVLGVVLAAALAVAWAVLSRDAPGPLPPAAAALPATSVPAQAPGSTPAASAPAPAAAPVRRATLHIETDPPGAKVKEDDETLCQATPCDIAYTGDAADPAFEHLLTFQKADYPLQRKLVKVGASPFSLKLARTR